MHFENKILRKNLIHSQRIFPNSKNELKYFWLHSSIQYTNNYFGKLTWSNWMKHDSVVQKYAQSFQEDVIPTYPYANNP